MEGDAVFDRLWTFADELSYDDLDAETIETAKVRVYDSLAVTLRAYADAGIRELASFAETRHADQDARLVGPDGKSAPAYASFVNAAAMRYYDWNDTYLQAEAAHPSGNLGAILALADAHDLSGEDVLLATVIAYEIQCRLCDHASFTDNGFDHVNYGLVSVPIAAAKLLGLSREEARHATSIAATGHLGLLQAREAPVSAWKGYAFANAARNSVVAIDLARAGVTGPADPFLGNHGLNTVLSAPIDPESLALGDGFVINDTHLKRYPICHHILAAVDAGLEIREDADFDWREVRSITVDTYEIAIRTAGDEAKWRPTTRGTADHSIPYCLARALVDGTIEPGDLEGDALHEEDIVDLMDAVTIQHDEAFTDVYGDAFPHRVTIETEQGEFEATVADPLGHVRNPLDWEDISGKLAGEGGTSLEVATDLRAAVASLDRASDVEDILDVAADAYDEIV